MSKFPAETVLLLLLALTVSSAITIASYVRIRLLCERPPHLWLYVNAAVVLVTGASLGVDPKVIAALLLSWTVATFADRNVQPSQESWFETFAKLAVSSACATLALFVLCAVLPLPFFWFSWIVMSNYFEWSALPYSMGGLFAPSVFAISLWLWKTRQMRPGIDRHLKEGETR